MKNDRTILICTVVLFVFGLAVQARLGAFGPWPWNGKIVELIPLFCAVIAFFAGWGLCAGGRAAKLGPVAGWGAYMLGCALLCAMLAFGRKFRGGYYLPGNINPTEMVKPLMVWFLAFYLCKHSKALSETQFGVPAPPWRTVAWLGVWWSAPLLLSVMLHDLGLLALLSLVLLLMLFAMSGRFGYLLLAGGAVFCASWAVRLLSPHAAARFSVWLNPFADPTGKSWQVLQALTAMYSGSWFGSGVGSGHPSMIPIVTTDFVYAAIAEELGFVGCAALIGVLLIFFNAAFTAAASAKTPFEKLLGAGIAISLAVQMLLNIGGVIKALPMTGIPLPFFSHGGSSAAVTMFSVGMLWALALSGGTSQKRKGRGKK